MLEAAAVFDPVAGRHLDLGIDGLLQIGHETAQIAVAHVGSDCNATLSVVAVDLVCALDHFHLGHTAQWHSARLAITSRVRQGRQRNRQCSDSSGVLTQCLGQAHHDVKTTITLEQLAGNFATDGGRHRCLHVLQVQPIGRKRKSVWHDRQQRQTTRLLHAYVGRTGHTASSGCNALTHLQQSVQVIAIEIDRHVGTHAGDQFIGTHLYRLTELVVVAWHLGCNGLYFCDQCLLALGWIRPLIARLQHHVGVAHGWRHWIGSNFRRAQPGEHALHLGDFEQARFQSPLHLHRLGQAGAGDAHGLQGDVAFVQVGHELATQASGQGRTARQQHHSADTDQRAAAQGEAQQRLVAPPQPGHHSVLLFLDLAPQGQGNGRRHEGQRQHHRAGQGHHHGDRHRVEHLSFHPAQGEDRQVHGRDDAQAEQAGTDHLRSGAGGQAKAFIKGQCPA